MPTNKTNPNPSTLDTDLDHTELPMAPTLDELGEDYRSGDALHIPQEAKDYFNSRGYNLFWVRVLEAGSVTGAWDMKNIQQKEAMGYVFVKRSEVKGLEGSIDSYFGDEFNSDRGLYRIGDLALARIPTARVELEKRRVAEVTRNRSQSIIADLKKDGAALNAGSKQGNSKEVISFGEAVTEKGSSSRKGFGE